MKKPRLTPSGSIYVADKIWTFSQYKKNEQWISYIYDRSTKRVVDFVVWGRSGDFLRPMISEVLKYQPRLIATDGLLVYKGLIPSNLHLTSAYQTLRIERNNLNLRTHLQRLSRKTICFSKNKEILKAVLRIYFWS